MRTKHNPKMAKLKIEFDGAEGLPEGSKVREVAPQLRPETQSHE
jgi:hypothetical protein